MLITESTNSGPVHAAAASRPADLPTAAAAAAWAADIYRSAANQVEAGMKGARDANWLRSQAAICLSRQNAFTELAQGEQSDRDAARWQRLALGYAEAARILTAGTERAGQMVAALVAAATQLKAAATQALRPLANSATPAYIKMRALRAAFDEAREDRTARALHTAEAEMLVLGCYARDHNPALMEAITAAVTSLAAARAADLAPESVTGALTAMHTVLTTAVMDPALTGA